MRTDVPEKILAINDAIANDGCANVTRLTVLKKWFARPERLSAFAVWVAARATSRKGKTLGEAAVLFAKARSLLKGLDLLRPQLDLPAAKQLHGELRAFQNEYERQRWGPVRKIKNWNLFVVEEALAICLGIDCTPASGYKLAADYCRHYDSRFADSLTSRSITKLDEIVRFMFVVEAKEDDPPEQTTRISR